MTLHFHGELKQFCPSGFTCWAHSAAEAVNLFFRQNRKAARERDGSKRVVQVANHCSTDTLTNALEVDRLDVCPAFLGSGGSGGGTIQAVIGAVLIAAAVVAAVFGQYWLAVPLGLSGLSMAIGGVLQMLSPSPRLDRPDATTDTPSGQTPEESRYLGAAGNTTASGTRIPLGYGRMKIYGHILSFDVEADPEPVLGQPPNSSQRRRVGNVA